MYSLGVFWRIALLVLGMMWCEEVIKRFGKDLKEMRGNNDTTTKGVIVIIWVLTLIIAVFIARFLYGLIMPILHAL